MVKGIESKEGIEKVKTLLKIQKLRYKILDYLSPDFIYILKKLNKIIIRREILKLDTNITRDNNTYFIKCNFILEIFPSGYFDYKYIYRKLRFF